MNRGEFRDLGHQVVDLLADYLEHIEEKPVFANVDPKMLTKLFAEPLPQDPSPAGKGSERVGGEASSLLHPRWAPRLYGINYSIANSSWHHWRLHWFRSQPKHRGLHDWTCRCRNGATHCAVANRSCRLWGERWRQPH